MAYFDRLLATTAELDDPNGSAQVQTKLSQLTYFNVFEWNDMIGKFWACMMALDEAEAAAAGGLSVSKSKADGSVSGGSGGPVGEMSGEDLIAAAIELSSRMRRKQGAASTASGAAGAVSTRNPLLLRVSRPFSDRWLVVTGAR